MSDNPLPTEASAFLKQTKKASKTTDVGVLLQLVDKFISICGLNRNKRGLNGLDILIQSYK